MHQLCARLAGKVAGLCMSFPYARVRLLILRENNAGNVGGNMIPNHVSG